MLDAAQLVALRDGSAHLTIDAVADGLMLQLLLGVAPFAPERQNALVARLHDLADTVVP